MHRALSFWSHSFASAMVITGVAATGCVSSPDTEATDRAASSVDHVAISDGAALAGLALDSVQYQRTAQGETISPPAGWTQTAPGEWTNSANGKTTTITIDPASRTAGLPPPPVTCNFVFFIGPSSQAVAGLIGEAAIGQANCVDGAASFQITTTACTDRGCSTLFGTGVASPGAPFTSGVAVPGTAGVTCLGTVNWLPPNTTVAGINACG